jgi:CheY-like chemotaxis protein
VIEKGPIFTSGSSVNRKLRILLVEDEPSDAALVERELRKGGLDFTLERVETEAAYRQALAPPVDLILSDHDLPAFSGLAALAIAKVKAEDVPFIFVTGSVGEEVAIQSLRDGATDYVRKRRLSEARSAFACSSSMSAITRFTCWTPTAA